MASTPDFSSHAASTSYTLPPHPNLSATSAPKPTASPTAAMVPLAAMDMEKFQEWLKIWYINFSKLVFGQPWLKLLNK
jgi:hypothetical protein